MLGKIRDWVNKTAGPGIFRDLDGQAQEYAQSHYKGG
jgi:hypothetical protein